MDIYSIIAIVLSLSVIVFFGVRWAIFLHKYLQTKKKADEPKCKVFRYYSMMNPWIDFCVVCKVEDSETAKAAIIQGMDDFWKGEWFPFDDMVTSCLNDAEIGYQIFYADLERDDDEDDIYEYMVSLFSNVEVLNY